MPNQLQDPRLTSQTTVHFRPARNDQEDRVLSSFETTEDQQTEDQQMYSFTRAAGLVTAMIVVHAVSVYASVQSQANQNKEPAGSISGRVTLADKPASGVTVMLMPAVRRAHRLFCFVAIADTSSF